MADAAAPETPPTGQQPPPATPTPTPTPAPIPTPPSTVTIPLDQLQAFTAMQARLSQIETDNRAREAQVEADKAAAMLKKGEVENALALLKKQSDDALAAAKGERAQIEERAKRYALDAELARVLAGMPLAQGAAGHLTKLFRDQFNVVPSGDSFLVQTPTLQTVEAFVTATLATPDYAIYLRPQNAQGGTGGVGAGTQTPPQPTGQQPPQPEVKTLSDAVFRAMAARTGQTADGTTDPTVAFGFRRKA